MPKSKSPSLTKKEISDVKKALKSKKWKTFDSAQNLIVDLRKNARV